MRYRTLGSTKLTVSEIGFGSWGIGGETAEGPNSYGKTDDAASRDALRTAFEHGITFFDTSNIYGYGHSEELIGETFKGMRDKVVIASKVGFTKHGGPHDLRPQYVRQELEKSLKRLQTDYLDLYQLHSPPLEMVQKDQSLLETFRELKREGKIRAFGYSVKHPNDALVAVGDFGFECIQVNLNMIDERAIENGLLTLAEEKNVGIIARTPFAFGFLTDTITDLNFPPYDHRSVWPRLQLERWAKASQLFSIVRERRGWNPAELALKFCLAFPAVSTVIPGILTPEQAIENASASNEESLSTDEIEKVIQIYKDNIFFERPVVKH